VQGPDEACCGAPCSAISTSEDLSSSKANEESGQAQMTLMSLTKDDVHRAVYGATEMVMGQSPTLNSASHIHFDVGMDSLDIIEFQQEIEDRLDVCLPDDFVDDEETIGSLINRIWETIAGPKLAVVNLA
jgi:acyl carrier protein